MTAWLPVLLADRLGMTPAQAGVSASIFQIAALAGAVGVPVLLRWCSGPRTAMAAVCGAWLVFLLGLLVVPAGWALWCAFGGAAQGGGLTVIFALVVRKARDAAENRRMSALVQGGGYTVAATGPFVLGVVHEASGEWTAPLAVVIGSDPGAERRGPAVLARCTGRLLTARCQSGCVPKKIILDCDPGHDDAIALLLAHGNPEIELLAITTVMGNSTLDNVTRNALVVATIAARPRRPDRRGLPAPAGRASCRPRTTIHGSTGLDGPVLPAPTRTLDPRHAVDVIIETVMREEPGTVTLVPTAALTNIALAVRKEPRIVDLVAEVVLMGGAVAGGNWSAAAEFNIVTDPEAAHIVFGEGWPVTMVGLDLTHQALATPDVVDRIAALGTATGPVRHRGAGVLRRDLPRRAGLPAPAGARPVRGGPRDRPGGAHDPAGAVTVELAGSHTRGMTVADLRAPAPPDCRTQVAVDLDHARFWDLVVDALERIGEP